MQKEKFERLVEEALQQIPKKFKKYIDNLVVIIEDTAPEEVYDSTRASRNHSILGVYHGMPLKYRGPYYGNIPPDVITIYQKPIVQLCASEQEIKQKVREVVLHEIGHYFGLSERRLREIESSGSIKK
jgi:predicted Zn-dependent protease with MMP-like domain